jgi:hypothetical protein
MANAHRKGLKRMRSEAGAMTSIKSSDEKQVHTSFLYHLEYAGLLLACSFSSNVIRLNSQTIPLNRNATGWLRPHCLLLLG